MGNFRRQGNGGFAGSIDYRWFGGAVSRGYASAATDTGHKGDATDASWALGIPRRSSISVTAASTKWRKRRKR